MADHVGDVIDDVKAAASDAADAVTAQAKEAYANARSAADEGVTYVKARYRENPAVVIGVGIAIAAAVVLILRRLFRG